jgi:predicted DNA-binding protein with PD1-like motif
MRHKIVTTDPAESSTHLLVLEPGEEVASALLEYAREHRIHGASFTGLGAVDGCVIAFYDREQQEYDELPLEEQLEVLSLVGNISMYEDAPRVHAHVVLGDERGHTRGGHLMSARVWPTLEITLHVHERPLRRAHDDGVGLPLLVP